MNKNLNKYILSRFFTILLVTIFIGTSFACAGKDTEIIDEVIDYPTLQVEEKEEETIPEDSVINKPEDLPPFGNVTITMNTELEFDRDSVMETVTAILEEEGYEDSQFERLSEVWGDIAPEDMGFERYYVQTARDEEAGDKNLISVSIEEYESAEKALEEFPGLLGAVGEFDEEIEDGISISFKENPNENGSFGYRVYTIKGNYVFRVAVMLYKTPSFSDDEDDTKEETIIDFYSFKRILDECDIAYDIEEEKEYGFY